MFFKLAQLACLATYANAVSIKTSYGEPPLVIMYGDYYCGSAVVEVEREGRVELTSWAFGSLTFDDADTCICFYSYAEQQPERDDCYSAADARSNGCVFIYTNADYYEAFAECPV